MWGIEVLVVVVFIIATIIIVTTIIVIVTAIPLHHLSITTIISPLSPHYIHTTPTIPITITHLTTLRIPQQPLRLITR
jgi:hypothetical protein